jgi:hypothetical protein
MRTKAMAIGDAIYLGIVDALNAGQTNVAYAAAALADTAITRPESDRCSFAVTGCRR